MDKGFYNFRGSGSRFTSNPIDRRRLNMKDRSDLSRGGVYMQQSNAYKRAKALNAQNKMLANRDQRTTTQKPGSGGFSGGVGIQQQRYREIGQQNERTKGFMPELEDNIYDIYKGDADPNDEEARKGPSLDGPQ